MQSIKCGVQMFHSLLHHTAQACWDFRQEISDIVFEEECFTVTGLSSNARYDVIKWRTESAIYTAGPSRKAGVVQLRPATTSCWVREWSLVLGSADIYILY
jgi:hypothetical protein